MIIGTMITAIRKVHAPKGPWVTEGGYEYNAVLIAAMVAIAESGPGKPSVDATLFPRIKGTAWALLALAAGVAGSYLATEYFNEPAPAARAGRPAPADEPRFEREQARGRGRDALHARVLDGRRLLTEGAPRTTVRDGAAGHAGGPVRIPRPDSIAPAVHEKRIEVRWRDVDNYGHVNNAVYLTYLEEVRDEWLARTLRDDEAVWDYVVAHVSIDFRREITQDDDEVVATCRAESARDVERAHARGHPPRRRAARGRGPRRPRRARPEDRPLAADHAGRARGVRARAHARRGRRRLGPRLSRCCAGRPRCR